MAASRTVIESYRGTVQTAALAADVERRARRHGRGSSSGQSPPQQAPPSPGVFRIPDGREAHLEEQAPSGLGVRATALQGFAAHLLSDENLGRRLRANPRRALAEVGYMSDAEKRVLADVDRHAMANLAEVSEKYKKAAVGTKAVAGIPTGTRYGDLVGDYGDVGGGAPAGWEGSGPPSGPGITVGGIKFPGRPGDGSRGSDEGGRGSGGGLGDMGRYGSHRGNAMDPKSPTGGSLGGSAAGSTGGGGAFELPAGSREGGWRGGPSRAELAGSACHALHPGRDASEDPKNPDGGTDGGTDGGGAAQPNPPEPQGEPLTEKYTYNDPNQAPTPVVASDSYTRDMEIGGTIGGMVGGVGGLAGGKGNIAVFGAGLVGGGLVGAVVGAAVHYLFHKHMPADDGTGPAGPRAYIGAAQVPSNGQVSRFLPTDDAGSPVGPRSSEARTHAAMSGSAARARDFTPPPDDPSGGGPSSRLYMPNPDDPTSPGNPHSREAAAISRVGRMR